MKQIVAAALFAPYILVLGVLQDGGLPHIGCARTECVDARKNPALRRTVSSIAVVDGDQFWVFDATPDFPLQIASVPGKLAGVFLTHAHIGHYTGLMYLGREAQGAKNVPVYAMPRMREFLTKNGPWSQLVSLHNIELRSAEETVKLNENISVTAVRVQHRDEYSETVAYVIRGPKKSVLFMPDTDKQFDIELIRSVDRAYIDGTFYAEGEIPGRSMKEIPHPFIVESMERLAPYAARIHFIHLNHTNPALHEGEALRKIRKAGFDVAKEGERFDF